VTKLLHYGWTIVLPLMVLRIHWWQFLIGYLAMSLTAGAILGLIFQLAHVVEGTDYPLPDAQGAMEHTWLIHQMMTTSNFAPRNLLLSWYVGGLNYQIEHHLFPKVCSVHYPAVSQIIRFWTVRNRRYCKPCWELKYCPYGPLVEDFPLLPQSLEDAQEHQAYLTHCLKIDRFPDGKRLTPKHRKMFQESINSFNSREYPEKFPRAIADAACRVFGHLCPVYFVGEPLTETKDLRSQSRSIPRDVMLKVVRRDGQICQRCYQPVPDDQVEFDHVIPFSKGGTTTPENLKLPAEAVTAKRVARWTTSSPQIQLNTSSPYGSAARPNEKPPGANSRRGSLGGFGRLGTAAVAKAGR
jgi:hypothetical protein